MILYHGSNVIVEKPRIIDTDRGRDFGDAFYLTPIKEQAERMAKRKQREKKNSQAFVSVFEWDEDTLALNFKDYRNPDKEWLDMIVYCRTNIKPHHEYDIIQGKIADDSVGETILYVLSGIISKEQAIEKLKFQKINSQIAFCTDKALDHLKFIEYYEVK